MAARLEATALAAERDAATLRRTGDWVAAAEARDRALAARRAAQILRAGPGGVREALAESA